jgi:hypothetical protein
MPYLVFSALEPLLPPGSTLVGNEAGHLLSLLARLSSEEQGRLTAQEHLTWSEWRVLMALIDAYPGYASYAHLLAVLTSSSEQACQQRLLDARTSGSVAVKHALRPLRKVLTPLHPKLQYIGLRAAAVQAGAMCSSPVRGREGNRSPENEGGEDHNAAPRFGTLLLYFSDGYSQNPLQHQRIDQRKANLDQVKA